METEKYSLDKFLLSWKFIVLIIVMQFILPPIATRGFQWEDFGTIIISTLSHAFILDMYSYAWAFQILAICMLLLLALRREKVSRWFMLYAGCCYVLYTINQNVALTEEYGLRTQGATPDCNLIHLFTGGSAMAFCPMTPVFLTLLILSKRDIDVALLRVTAFIGFVIGCYNMANFATDAGLYLGLYHLPLIGMSLYALLISKKKKNN